jgi:small conductance mechanosensitive channel
VWLIARRVISYVARLVVRSLKYPFDQTVAGYIGTAVVVLLNVGLILGILGLFGIETTSFAALLAGVGIAVGTAWRAARQSGRGHPSSSPCGRSRSETSSGRRRDRLRAGDRPLRDDLDTMDNIRTFVGNNKILSDNVQNFTANPYRRVDLVAQLHNAVDAAAAVRLLKAGLVPHPPRSSPSPRPTSRS